MKFSLNTIRGINRRYGCAEDIAPEGVEVLVEKIGAQLGAVDGVVEFGKKYEGVVVARIVSCVKHPNADKLNICVIDDRGNTPSVKRNSDSYIQVVCGASNVREGLLVAWLPPGATVPNTHDTEPFVLEARELRGELSNGMLASPKELGLGDNHDGILEIDGDVKPGTAFVDVYDLRGDVIVEIENKMFTHRPDLFGFLGVARELAGIQGMAYKSPDWYVPTPEFPPIEAEELPLIIKNELPDLVPRFTAIAMSQVQVGPSPVWLQIELAKVDQKSINNIVDYTNWFMLETGQPLHAYDYDKVKALSGSEGATIVVRHPKAGETMALLNGKTIEPRAEAMMIATDQQLIGIGGVMGGVDTEVDASTTNIILECANFDMYSVRRTSMAHGLFTEAVTRFTKGQSPLQNLAVLAKIIDELRQYAGGKVASEVIDIVNRDDIDITNFHYREVAITSDFINARLGLELAPEQIETLLKNVEFGIKRDGEKLAVSVPFWRTDIKLREDVVEEVGRLHGFDTLPLILPRRDLTPATKDPLFELKANVRAQLSKAGANEVLTYSFVPGSLLDRVGQDRAQAYELSNALSPDLQYYRPSLTPSLLEKIHPNLKAGHGEFALFELGKAHVLGEPDALEPKVPKEVNALSFVYAAKKAYGGAPYYWARKNLIDLLVSFRVVSLVRLEPLDGADLYKNPWLQQMIAPFEPKRSAVLRDSEGLVWGVVGEFKASVRRQLKLPDFSAGFEIDPLLMLRSTSDQTSKTYQPLPKFPKVTQDITLQVPAEVRYQALFDFVWSELGKIQPDNTLPSLSPVDIYQSEDDKDHKNITLRLEIVSYDRTLTDAEVNKLLDQVAIAAQTKLKAHRM